MAPFLAMTSRQTFLRPSAQAAATRRACCERQMARTRALNAVFPKAGRPACRSSRSRWRNRFRSQAQNFSIGFKSGDLGGTDQRMTLAVAWAAALSRVRRNASLSHSTNHGPCSFTGFKLRIAPVSLPRFTPALTPKAYNSEEKGCQRCRSQGHKEDREDLEERDSTTRQRLAICAHSHSVTKSGLSKTVSQETAR